ncbi:CvpA family protein [Paludibacterium paludis]|uniref:Bacteriocin production protein n=1 Tax=Paludibacterium paludis TaxID=1225769 RepID=A0A918P6B1_9NEIS|nr:CvpA family protein [Paludibacterium paludis]GGY24989.1 bacteriocin production protein [Paludibacterium paludis]
MTVFDYAVLAILAGSAVIALMRGFVAEVLSLGAWLVAFWCAKEFSPAVSAFMPSEVPTEGLRLVAAFVLLFFLVWLATALLRVTLTGLLDAAGLGGVNRLFGALFGLARGAVLVVILVLVAGLTDIPREPMWRNAVLSPPLERMAILLKPWLPAMLADNIRYSG